MRKCFDVKRSSTLEAWSRRPLSTLPNGGVGDASAEPATLSEVDEKLAAMPKEHLDDHVKKQLKEGAEQWDEPSSTLGLPLSPLMDPKLIAARNRHRTPKPQPSGPPSALTEKLLKNPYAQTLATPIRACHLTGARLPSAFLLNFGLAKHPETGALWHLPEVALDSTPSPGKPKEAKPKSSSSQSEPPDPTPQNKPKPLRTAPHTHFLAHSPVLHLLSSLKPKNYIALLPRRWKADAGIAIDSLIWRKDMDAFVLETFRKRALKLLKYLSGRPAAYIAACRGYDAARESHQVAVVLWLGPCLSPEDSSKGDNTPASTNTTTEPPNPPPYATLTYRSHQIPIYNLPTLLGPTHLQQLRDSSPVFGGEMAVLKGKRGTVKAQTELWRLMGYLSFPGG